MCLMGFPRRCSAAAQLPALLTPPSTFPSHGSHRPTTVLYVVDGDKGAGGTSGLSAGAIAGIVVGSTAVVAALAGLAWWRQRRRRQLWRQDMAAGQEAGVCTPKAAGKASPGGSSSSSPACGREPPASGASPARVVPLPPLSASPHSSGLSSEQSALPELVQHVEQHDAAAARSLGLAAQASEHVLLSATTLPPRLREWVVDPSAVEYLRWPNGSPIEIGRGASARVYKALLNGALHVDSMAACLAASVGTGAHCMLLATLCILWRTAVLWGGFFCFCATPRVRLLLIQPSCLHWTDRLCRRDSGGQGGGHWAVTRAARGVHHRVPAPAAAAAPQHCAGLSRSEQV